MGIGKGLARKFAVEERAIVCILDINEVTSPIRLKLTSRDRYKQLPHQKFANSQYNSAFVSHVELSRQISQI